MDRTIRKAREKLLGPEIVEESDYTVLKYRARGRVFTVAVDNMEVAKKLLGDGPWHVKVNRTGKEYLVHGERVLGKKSPRNYLRTQAPIRRQRPARRRPPELEGAELPAASATDGERGRIKALPPPVVGETQIRPQPFASTARAGAVQTAGQSQGAGLLRGGLRCDYRP